MWVQAIISFVIALSLHNIKIGGEPIEIIKYSWEAKHIFSVLALALGSSTLCWLIRTNVMKYIDATAVAVIMPCSAVVTAILAVLFGKDTLTLNFVLGASIAFLAAVLSGVAGALDTKKKQKTQSIEESQ